MHIKQIIIQGFKTYKEQTVIEPFSPGTNVIVGRNGSGKSNFFAAIRFVLGDGDDFHHMKAQDRARLLHEGSGSAVMSAYVEIIFDNTDKRFSEPGDEVVIRRTIGMKKDEYSVDRKAQTRAEVMKILETAGFAKENPFYIVPQGRIAAITNMKESERLNLLKEIAGTITYDDRRSQSLILMKETTTKREKIDELLTYIEERLNELEEEKNDLHQFQIKDRERRCLEYAHWHRLHESTIEKLQQIEAAKQGGAGATNKETTQLQQVEREIADLEQKYQEVDENLEFLETERRQLDEDRKEKARSRAKAELNVKNLDAGRHAHEQQKKAREAALNEVRQKIEALEKELATIAPQYGNWKAEEERFRTERDQIKDKRDRLMTKQTRSSQFKTKAERDNYLKQEINQITQSLGTQKAIRVDHVEQAERLKQSIAQLEQEIQEKRKEKGSYSDKREALYQKLQSAEAACDRLTEERRQLQREVHNFDSKVSSATKKLEKAQGTLARVMDGPTAKGLAAIKRFTRERNIPGAYGTLAELMTIPVEGYRLAAETIASKSLFHYVVDNHVTATILGEHLQKNALGRVTFLPLEQLRPKQVKMPRASDAQPLISKIEYDPKYEKAFQLVFGRTIVCPTMSIGIQYARTHGLDAITPEGELANKRGALTGGYIDPGRSRLEAVQEVNRVQDERAQYEAEREKVEEQLNVVVQQITKSLGESKKLEQELRDLDRSYSSLDEALQAKISELERERPHLKALELRLQGVEKYLNDLDNQLSAAEAELQTDFKKVLSAEEDRELEELSRQLPTLTAKVRSANKKRLELESRKDSIELQLESQLRPREDQLQSQAIEFLSGGASGNFKDAAKELQRAEKAAAVVEAQLRENEEKIAEVAAQRAKLDTVKAQKEAEKEELERRIDQYKKKMQKSILREAQLVIEAKAYEKNISELGILPEEAFGKYEKMKSEQITNNLRKCKEALKKFGHINKKAFDQYNSFTTQRDQLLKRRGELDESQDAIEKLIEHLDTAKDEAIERTFKQVSKEFATIFEQLVPAGHGRLVIQRRTDRGAKDKGKGRGRNAAADSDDDQANSVDNYTGVGISVSFNSKHMDEQQKIQQLSGGQKSLCALCLIFALQAAESSPFVIFDEVDANLDAQYRTAVASLLERISKTQKTQFICTTFRPEMVLVADKCYGVTFHNKTSTIDCVPTEDALNFVEGQKS